MHSNFLWTWINLLPYSPWTLEAEAWRARYSFSQCGLTTWCPRRSLQIFFKMSVSGTWCRVTLCVAFVKVVVNCVLLMTLGVCFPVMIRKDWKEQNMLVYNLASFGDLPSFCRIICRAFSELRFTFHHLFVTYSRHNIWKNWVSYTSFIVLQRIPEQSRPFRFWTVNPGALVPSGHQQEITT